MIILLTCVSNKQNFKNLVHFTSENKWFKYLNHQIEFIYEILMSKSLRFAFEEIEITREMDKVVVADNVKEAVQDLIYFEY